MAETTTLPYSHIASIPFLDYVRTIVLVFTGLPISIVSVVRRRLSTPKNVVQLPLVKDLALTLARWVARRLPLSVGRQFGHRSQKNIDKILAAPRFRDYSNADQQQQLCEEVIRPDFSGFWVCKGGLGAPQKPPSESDLVWLDFHGGAYFIGHPLMKLTHHLRIAEIVAAETGKTMSIFSGRYFLAPDACWPTQQKQALAAYRYLIEEVGVQPGRIVVGGDSAGGHLAIALLVVVAEEGLPRPGGALLVCPWVDLTNSGSTMESNRYLDSLSKEGLDQATRRLVGSKVEDWDKAAGSLNFAEPREGKFTWKDILPSVTVLTAGSYEVLLSGSKDFCHNARKDGTNVELEITPEKGHCWQWHADWTTEKKYLNLAPKDKVEENVAAGSRQVGDLMLRVIKAMESE